MGAKKLFGTRGIRGPIATKMTPKLALKLGLALATSVGGEGEVVVARDARTSGEMVKHAFVAGLLAGGCDVVDIGLAPSPCLAFTARELKAKAGVVITASHNPPPDNGMAFYTGEGMEFLSEHELEIEDILLNAKFRQAGWDELGTLREDSDAITRYLKAIAGSVEVKRGFKVVIDCANGVGSLTTPYLLRELGCKVVTLNSHIDGHFPGRPPEPQPWNIGDLMRTVREIGADIGFAHDGDADRVVAVDEKGRFVKHDALIALFAEEELKAKGRGIVMTSINTSVAIEEVAARAGGKALRAELGNLHAAMLKHDAVFAGEPGKLLVKRWGIWADGIYGAARVLELLSREGKPFSEIVARVPDYPMYVEDFPCPDERKAEFMRGIREYLLKNVDEVRDLLDIDGLRVNRKNGSWILIRVSGTEPKARIVLEGRSQAEVDKLKEIGLRGIREFLK